MPFLLLIAHLSALNDMIIIKQANRARMPIFNHFKPGIAIAKKIQIPNKIIEPIEKIKHPVPE